RGAGTGGDEDGVGRHRHELIDRALVVAQHDGLGAELPQVLDEVVDEAVVVVDDQDPGRHGGEGTGGPSRPGNRLRALSGAAVSRRRRDPAPRPRRAPPTPTTRTGPACSETGSGR